jgi:hypothetical protein
MTEPSLASDPTYYRIEYARIAQLLHERTAAREKVPAQHAAFTKDKQVTEALRLVRREVAAERKPVKKPLSLEPCALVSATRRELLRLGWRWVGRSPSRYLQWFRRARWFRRVRGYTYVSRADHRLAVFLDEVLEPAAGGKLEAESLGKPQLPGRALDRRSPTGGSADAVSEKWLRAYLDELISPRPARRGDWRQAAALMGATRWQQPRKTNYRVHYNLACLFSRLDERAPGGPAGAEKSYLDSAAEQLSLSVSAVGGAQRRALLEWAGRDPGLAGLMAQRPELLKS